MASNKENKKQQNSKESSSNIWSTLGRFLTNATIGASVADQPAVTTAAGWQRDKNGNWNQGAVSSEGAQRLRESLAAIGIVTTAGAAAPLIAPGTVAGSIIGATAGSMALGTVLEEGQRAIAGQSTGDIISKYLQQQGVHPMLADVARPEYYLMPTGVKLPFKYSPKASPIARERIGNATMSNDVGRFEVTPQEAEASELLNKISKMSAKEQQRFFSRNMANSVELMHKRGLTGGYDRIGTIQKQAWEEIRQKNPEIYKELRQLQRNAYDPKWADNNGAFDYNKYYSSLSREQQRLLRSYEYLAHDSTLPYVGMPYDQAYKAPIEFRESITGSAGANPIRRRLYQGSDHRLSYPKVKAHEEHHLMSPTNTEAQVPFKLNTDYPISDTPSPTPSDYKFMNNYLFNKGRGLESSARLSQLYNWYGIDDGTRVLTPEEFDFASRYYTKTRSDDPSIDNNMTEWFGAAKGHTNELLKWIGPSTLTLAPLVDNE